MISTTRRIGFAAIVAMGAAAAAQAEKLPVFKLAAPQADAAEASAIFAAAFGQKPSANAKAGAVLLLSQGKLSIEVDRRSGYYFLADENLFLNADARGQAPDANTARQIADTFVQRNSLLAQGAEFKVAYENTSVTGVRIDAAQEFILDRHVNYATTITANGREFPVVGGGGQQKVVVGSGGRIVAYAGGWRPITGVADTVEIKSQQQALAEYLATSGKGKVGNIKMYLAYYAAPSFEPQSHLAPVWVLSGTVQAGGREMPLRVQILPATNYGPKFGQIKPFLKKRGPSLRPANPPARDEFGMTQRGSLLDSLIPPARAQARVEADSDCSSWWITDRLPSVFANRQGFFDGCRAHGFAPAYDWGDVNAWETDWTLYDDNEGADTSDVTFYTGHADANGWVLMPPADGALTFPEVGDTGGIDDRYGKFDMEHLIIAACGPHQSRSFVSGVDHADIRWRRIFGGLHTFQGYGAVTFDTASEGSRFMELIRSGRTVIYSWIRTGIDIQGATNGEAAPNGPNIFVTSMKTNHRTNRSLSTCIGNETMRVGGSGCADIASSDVSLVFIYAGT